MIFQLHAAGIRDFEREHRFHPVRRWRFDIAFPDRFVALEVEGGVYTGGRHVTPQGFTADAEKYNTATLMGWRVLRVTKDHIKSGQALTWVEELLFEVKGVR